MATLLSPDVFVQEEQPQVAVPTTSPTATTGLVAVTQRGPTTPAFVTSVDDWIRLYGLITIDAQFGPLFVEKFFTAGGRGLWTQRVLHYTDIQDPITQQGAQATFDLLTASSAPSPAVVGGTLSPTWNVPNGGTLVGSVEGNADQVVTFNSTVASKLSATGGTYNIPDLSTLTIPISIDGDIVFDTEIVFDASFFGDNTVAKPWEVVSFINDFLKFAAVSLDDPPNAETTSQILIKTDGRGTDFVIGEVTGTAAALFSWPAGATPGGGNVGDGTQIDFTELESLTEAAFTNGSGVDTTLVADKPTISTIAVGDTITLQIQPSSTAAGIFGFPTTEQVGGNGAPAATLTVRGRWIGTYANDLTIEITAPTSGNAGEFNLIVLEGDAIRETFSNMVIGLANELESEYVEAKINGLIGNIGSNLIEVVDLDLGAPDSTPAIGLTSMLGGDDGLAGLVDIDFIGSSASASGLRGFDKVSGIRLIAIPEGATPPIAQAILTYCEITREGTMFAVIDPPANFTAQQIKEYVEVTASLKNSSEYGAIYWPRLKVLNPRRDVFGNVDNIVVPPSGIICGVFARTDAARIGGIYDTPAGTERGILTGATGFETDEVLDKPARDLIFPARINPLRTEEGQPRYIDGPLTLKQTGQFPTVAQRRGVINIEDLLIRGLAFVKHSDIDLALLARANRAAFTILKIEMDNSAFASADPLTAFKVDTGPGVNTPQSIKSGQVIVRVGLATKTPALFVIILVSQDTTAIDAVLAGVS